MQDTFKLTEAGTAFLDILFPKPLDVAVYISCVGGFGRIGDGPVDSYKFNGKLKIGRYWTAEECGDTFAMSAAGGVTQTEAIAACDEQLMLWLSAAEQLREKGLNGHSATVYRSVSVAAATYRLRLGLTAAIDLTGYMPTGPLVAVVNGAAAATAAAK